MSENPQNTGSETPTTPQIPANGLYVGEIRLLPFRHDELPFGWYFCNGERFLLTSTQGEILGGLSDNFRADWGMDEDLCSISLPNLFSEDGRGCFLRPVDGVKRQVGAEEGDQFQGHWHIYGRNYSDYAGGKYYSDVTQGVSYLDVKNKVQNPISDGVNGEPRYGAETRPLNLGMTPAIFLGV